MEPRRVPEHVEACLLEKLHGPETAVVLLENVRNVRRHEKLRVSRDETQGPALSMILPRYRVMIKGHTESTMPAFMG